MLPNTGGATSPAFNLFVVDREILTAIVGRRTVIRLARVLVRTHETGVAARRRQILRPGIRHAQEQMAVTPGARQLGLHAEGVVVHRRDLSAKIH